MNPAQIERQIAGSFVYGLSALFHGGITVMNGRVEQENFDSYDSLRIKDMPKVESIVMPSGGFWGGVGEPTICVAAPAVLNAFFAATGKRIRSVPLKSSNIQFACRQRMTRRKQEGLPRLERLQQQGSAARPWPLCGAGSTPPSLWTTMQ